MENEYNKVREEYSDQLKSELDDRFKAYSSGKEKLISATESKRRLDDLLKKHKLNGSTDNTTTQD